MDKKSLPKVKKSLKSFILEEDAKVMDKSMIKIAVVASFAGTMMLGFSGCGDDGNSSHWNHENQLNVQKNNPSEGDIHHGINPTDNSYQNLVKKSVTTTHANHFNNGQLPSSTINPLIQEFHNEHTMKDAELQKLCEENNPTGDCNTPLGYESEYSSSGDESSSSEHDRPDQS